MLDETPKIATRIIQDPHNQRVSSDFAIPLGAATGGRLVFASGAADLNIEANTIASQLYRAHFEEHIPSVLVQENIITIQYRRHLPFDGLADQQPFAHVALNRSIPWEIEFRHGVSRLTADLRQLQVCALDMGSVSTTRLMLSAPTGQANIYLSGSASDLTLHRPAGVALCLQIAGAASHLTLDGQVIDATHGGVRWQSRDYNDNANRYDVGIAGSVSNLTVGTFQLNLSA